MKMFPTLSSVLEHNRGIGPGFDFLRLFLSLSVLFWHSFVVCRGLEWGVNFINLSPYRGAVCILLPSFFALSGFLVAGSMQRTGYLEIFILHRALRILPALATEICLSALILGPLITTANLRVYFTSPLTLGYFGNIIGNIHYVLPGVFSGNPIPDVVNNSLWTIPAELKCYLVLVLLAHTGILKRKILLTVVFLCAAAFLKADVHANTSGQEILSMQMLITCFISGVIFYAWREYIPFHYSLLLLSIAGFITALYGFPHLLFVLGALCITYITVFAGLSPMPRLSVLMAGDYSYGIYLYAYPIQQTVVWLLPKAREPYYVVLIATPVTIGIAMLSWRYIEKPALALKRKIGVPFKQP